MRTGRRKRGNRVKLKCLQCEQDFELLESVKRAREKNGKKIKFCSKQCEGEHRTKAIEVSCKNCGKKFKTTRNRCCSVECAYDYKKKTGCTKRGGFWYENGYKILYLEDGSSIKEHIKVMEDHIGRKLLADEVVHHINEKRDDNRLENLQLMTRGEHSKLHRLKELQEGKKLFN